MLRPALPAANADQNRLPNRSPSTPAPLAESTEPERNQVVYDRSDSAATETSSDAARTAPILEKGLDESGSSPEPPAPTAKGRARQEFRLGKELLIDSDGLKPNSEHPAPDNEAS